MKKFTLLVLFSLSLILTLTLVGCGGGGGDESGSSSATTPTINTKGSTDSCIMDLIYLEDGSEFSICADDVPNNECSEFASVDETSASYATSVQSSCAVLNFTKNESFESDGYLWYIQSGLYNDTYNPVENTSGESSSEPTQTLHATVVLPVSSPMEMSTVKIDILDNSFSPNSDAAADITLPSEYAVDATIMLPAREQDPYPVVYMFSTVLPGESDVEISTEETAISLLMNTITKTLLVNAGTPDTVKAIIKEEGKAFIDKFKVMLENDPYSLALNNLDNVYDQTYINSADACRNALQSSAQKAPARALFDTQKSLSGSLLKVEPNQQISDFSVYENTIGSLGFVIWELPDWDFENATGKVDGRLIIENDTMLFAYYKVTDILTGVVIQDYPKAKHTNRALAMIDLIAGKNIIGPQKDWAHAWWASTANFNIGYQSVKVEIATPSVLSDDNIFLHQALALRTAVATFNNLLAQVIPFADLNGAQGKFLTFTKYMIEAGLMDTVLDKIGNKDIKGAIEEIFLKLIDKTAMDAIMKKVMDDSSEYISDVAAKKILGRFYTKFSQSLKKVPIAKLGLAADLLSLEHDYLNVPSEIIFSQVDFPFYFSDIGPDPLPKTAKDADLPRITITGKGFNTVYFNGYSSKPKITVEAKDVDDKTQKITIDEKNVHSLDDGATLWFELPKEWAEIGSPIVGPLYISVEHGFVDPHGVDEFISLKLPNGPNATIQTMHKEKMKINFNHTFSIVSFDKETVTKGDDLKIFGEGFAPNYNYQDNHLYFTDHTNNIVKAVVTWGNNDYIETSIPDNLEIGPLKALVKLYDKDEFKSNSLSIPLVPKIVTASSSQESNYFEDTIEVSLTQPEGYDILYTIDDSSTVLTYTSSLSLEKSTSIFPFSRVTVNGVDYDSSPTKYSYYKCESNEIVEEGTCVVNGDLVDDDSADDDSTLSLPTASPGSEEFIDSIKVTLTSLDNAEIRYIVTMPDQNIEPYERTYTEPIFLNHDANITTYTIKETYLFVDGSMTTNVNRSETVVYSYIKKLDVGTILHRCNSLSETHLDGKNSGSSLSEAFNSAEFEMNNIAGSFSAIYSYTISNDGRSIDIVKNIFDQTYSVTLPLDSYNNDGSDGYWDECQALKYANTSGQSVTFYNSNYSFSECNPTLHKLNE